MADTKLSLLTELAVEPADTDEIYVNDGGTSKRITYGTLKTALLARANHTGTQLASTISDFASAVAADATVTANTAKLSADDPALISALAEVTAEGGDYAVILDTSVSPHALKKILISDLLDNASHTGDVTGSGALTAQPAIITGKGAVTVDAADLLLVTDVSVSPQVLGQVTAQSIADLRQLTADDVIGEGPGAVDGADVLLTVDVSASPQILARTTAASVAALATPEGTAILSTGETGGTKFLREDGDGTCSWQTVPAGTGDLKADGTVPLTADWDVGSFDITAAQFHSDIATGTAPFTVASTTVVTNLNADQVDGNEASALLARANHTGTQTASTISDFDTEVANNSAVSANTAKVTNATHSGDAVGDGALTLQPAAITGKGAVTVDGADLLLVTDVSASPQVLGQVTAQSIANLAPAVQGSAILSSDTSPLVTDGYVLTADGAGGAAWEAAAAGSGDFMADGTVDMTGEFKTDVGTFGSDVADGASAVAFRFGNTAAYSTSGAKLLVLDNAGTDVFGFSYQGGISHLNSGATTAAHAQSLNFNLASSNDKTSSGIASGVYGWHNRASGNYSHAIGDNNSVTGAQSQAVGSSNVVSGVKCYAIGSSSTAGSTTGSFAIGTECEASAGYGCMTLGAQGSNANRGALAYAAGRFAAAGDAQTILACLKNSTTDATQTTLKAYTVDLVIPADTSWAFSALVIGRSDEADGNDSAAYRLEGLLTRDESNNTALVGSVTKTVIAESAGATAWDVTAEADDTNEALAIKVTGEAATNIRWVAKVDIAQVTYA